MRNAYHRYPPKHYYDFVFQILGIEKQIADLNIIHVAGTKGKVHLHPFVYIFLNCYQVISSILRDFHLFFLGACFLFSSIKCCMYK